MTKKQAAQKGLAFSGSYERSKVVIDKILEHYRGEGYKAHIVTVPDNPLSCGPLGVGYSVYIEKKYFLDREAERHRNVISMTGYRAKAAQTAFDETLAKIKSDTDESLDWLKTNGY